MKLLAVFKNENETVRLPVLEKNGRLFLRIDKGVEVPFAPHINPTALGLRLLLADAQRDAAIQRINLLFFKLAQHDREDFLAANPDFQKAFDSDFADVPIERILVFRKRVKDFSENRELEYLARAAKGKIFHFFEVVDAESENN
jgi:hypothetical protein